jgi:protein dispatched 1
LSDDPDKKQKEYYKKFIFSLEESLLEEFKDFKEFDLVSTVLTDDIFSELVASDTSFSVFSVMLVYCYCVFHLQSFFLSSIGITIILLSFPITTLMTEGVFRVTFFSSMHTLTVFIVLGISADNIFVLFDAWRQSEKLNPRIMDTKAKRMAYTWRRAVRAITVTASTTAVAFAANIFSPLMPIAAFGIFAGAIIPMNFILIILIFPAAIIFFDENIKNRKCCGCFFKNSNKSEV